MALKGEIMNLEYTLLKQVPKNWVCGAVCHPRKVGEENMHGDDVIITIYRLVPDYVVGRSTSGC